MKNKISIDELVRQEIAKGEEPHNLGAWANMERMLDGKNPYAKEEEDSRRKPWLFMLFGLMICSTAVIGGYNYLSQDKSESNAIVANQKNTNALISETSPVSNKANNVLEAPITEVLEKQDFSSERNNNAIAAANSADISPKQSFHTVEPKQNKAVNTKKHIAPSKTGNLIASKPAKNTSNLTSLSPTTVNSQSNPSNIDPMVDTKLATQSLAKTAKQPNAKNHTGNNIPNANTSSAALLAKNTDNNNIEPTILEKYVDTMNATKLVQRIERDRYGNKKYITDSSKFKIITEKEREVINPRFVALTAEQEEAAQRRTAIASNSEEIDAPTMQSLEAASPSTSNSVGLTANSKNTTQTSKSKRGFFTVFKELGQKAKQKSIQITHTPIPIYTGMFAGVNAALINTKHNFGGFQGGFTAMTPLSRLFSLQAEARFMHKNNSGYTVTDSRNTIMNKTVDNTSWTHGTIYNYEIDSVSTGHNLKSFYTIQVPVLLNMHINKKFNAYAGIHLNYGLRMNTNATQSSHPLYISDTVVTGSSYTERTNTVARFTSEDFGSRLGLGYTLGGSYDINSKLYVDLRMSNLFWDNTKGAAKQEISDVFFKIPSFQLSVGYRFRKFDKER